MLKNKVNNKFYIGKTLRDLNVRYERHLKDAKYGSNLPIHRALLKYGKENFDVIILEENIPEKELSEKEKFYIKKYDAVHNGYNLSYGGDGGRISKYSDKQIYNVKCLLRDTNKSVTVISQETGVSVYMVRDINRGKCLRTKDFSTPIRPKKDRHIMSEEEANHIIEMLLTKKYCLSEVAEQTGFSVITVSRINSGVYHKKENIIYPIISVDCRRSDSSPISLVKEIIYDISHTNLPLTEIALKHNVKSSKVNDINNGNTWREFWDGEYPIRKCVYPITEANIDYIIYDIVESTMLVEEICEKYNISKNLYLQIKKGKHALCQNKPYIFPLTRKYVKDIRMTKEKYNRVLYLIQNTNMTQKDISKETGVSPATIKKIREGTYKL